MSGLATLRSLLFSIFETAQTLAQKAITASANYVQLINGGNLSGNPVSSTIQFTTKVGTTVSLRAYVAGFTTVADGSLSLQILRDATPLSTKQWESGISGFFLGSIEFIDTVAVGVQHTYQVAVTTDGEHAPIGVSAGGFTFIIEERPAP